MRKQTLYRHIANHVWMVTSNFGLCYTLSISLLATPSSVTYNHCVCNHPILTLWCDSDSTTPPARITPDRLAQVPYDPNYVLDNFLNSDRPFNAIEPMETLEARISRIRARLQDFDTRFGSR